MKLYFNIIFFLLLNISAKAQLYKKHDWKQNQVFFQLTEEEKKLPSIAIKEKYLIQYYQTIISQEIRLFETNHNIIRVNSEKGIKKHNRVYIPMYNVKKVISIKARVTQKNGKIKILNKNNIKELKNVKNYGDFKIFALEGVTKDSQLEVIYTLEKHLRSLGSVVVQKNYNIRNAEVILRKPRVLGFRVKEYNGFPKMTLQRIKGNKEALTATLENIEAMTDEKSASPKANRMKVLYQVASNYASNSNMWDNLTQNIQKNYIELKPNIFSELIEDYKKYKKNNPAKESTQIINNICKYVTSNYNILRKNDEKLSQLKYAIRSKQATEKGVLKIYSCLFNYENINYEIVLTSNRFNHKFDRNFFSSSNLNIALLFFKDEEMYIEPNNVNTRLNDAPENTIGNNGIFIGSNASRIKKIKVPNAGKNVIERNFKITVDTNKALAKVSCHHKNTGYRAKKSRGAYKYLKNKDLDTFKEFTCISGIEDAEIQSFEVKNENLFLATNNIPFIFNYTYNSESLIEEVHNDFLLNFGKVIGTQNELYQEGKRVNPIELKNLITYKYKIEIEIPEGFSVKNIENININKTVDLDGVAACRFVSKYSFQNDTIIIEVIESYNQLHMALENYQGYKDVVNSAFDFSKMSILFKSS